MAKTGAKKILEIKNLKQHFGTPNNPIKAVDGISLMYMKAKHLDLLVNLVAVNQRLVALLFVYMILQMAKLSSTVKTFMGKSLKMT